jgi:FtsH-binding integral membrane protein
VGDYSWVIALVLGGGVLAALALMLYDWRRDTFTEDLRNVAIGAVVCTAAITAANALHVRHSHLLFAPVASAVAALFSKEERSKKLSLHLTVFGCSVGAMVLDNALIAYQLERYQWPIMSAAFVAALGVAIAWRRKLAKT